MNPDAVRTDQESAIKTEMRKNRLRQGAQALNALLIAPVKMPLVMPLGAAEISLPLSFFSF
ncbi:hypothetical protein ASE07_24205 [Noviherbaspirillum sp. Root189]|nr:hypothetical protein ASE07_24205 [Noviherbaspirillum sp. Root189]